jgi:hypothetical protein
MQRLLGVVEDLLTIRRPQPPPVQERDKSVAGRSLESVTGVFSPRAENPLDTHQVIVSGGPLTACGRTELDLWALGCDGDIRDRLIFSLPGSMRHHARVAG